MRLSDAIALGRTLITFDPSVWANTEKNCGCAVGMGAAAIGKLSLLENDAHALWKYFPILAVNHPMPEIAVRKEIPAVRIGELMRTDFIVSVIARNVKDGSVTLDQLIDWVRGVEELVETVPVPVESKEEVPVHAFPF